MTPELKARQEIDRLLGAAGWHVRDMAQANIYAARAWRLCLPPAGNAGRLAAGPAASYRVSTGVSTASKVPVALSPLAEPQRIVAKVDHCLSLIRTVEVDTNL